MSFNLTEYINILSLFTNPLHIFLSGVYWAIGAFAFFTILVIIFRKRILVRRKYFILKALSWCYLLLIPVMAALFGFKFGVLDGTRVDLKDHVLIYTKSLDLMIAQLVGKTPDEFIEEIGRNKKSIDMQANTNQVIDRFAEDLYSRFERTIEVEISKRTGSNEKMTLLLFTFIKSERIAEGIKFSIRNLLSRVLGIDKNRSEGMMKVKFKEIINRGLFTSILEEEIDHLFIPFEKGVVQIFGLLLLFPLLEIVVSTILNRRWERSLAATKEENDGIQ